MLCYINAYKPQYQLLEEQICKGISPMEYIFSSFILCMFFTYVIVLGNHLFIYYESLIAVELNLCILYIIKHT